MTLLLVVDRILEVIDEYQIKIHNLEHDIIFNPNLDTIRSRKYKCYTYTHFQAKLTCSENLEFTLFREP